MSQGSAQDTGLRIFIIIALCSLRRLSAFAAKNPSAFVLKDISYYE